MTSNMIPFEVDTSRIIELLAKQIYQSPLALLRENVQNAFDAVRERIHLRDDIKPRIDVKIEHDKISISDNGIGMSPDELKRHFWTAGSSSKNTQQARDAGVVGTFGIGAMANFGIASTLTVETESARSGERSWSMARKDSLSLKEDCVQLENRTPTNQSGTIITAHLSVPGSISVKTAQDFITGFVSLVDIPIYVNNSLVSCQSVESVVPKVAQTWSKNYQSFNFGNRLKCDAELVISNNADVWLRLTDLTLGAKAVKGQIVLSSGKSNLRALRSGFGLASAPVSSAYSFGGIADLLALEPTAGREAITSEGISLLQSIMLEIDKFVSEQISDLEVCNSSTPFMNWVKQNNRIELLGKLTIELAPVGDKALNSIVGKSLETATPLPLYKGNDPAIIKLHATDETVLLVLSRTNPRRVCQELYLQKFAKISEISNQPQVTERRSGVDLVGSEWGLAYRIEGILEADYFVNVKIDFGKISHNLPVFLENSSATGTVLVLNPDASTVSTLLQIYETDFDAASGLAKDFVRNTIFPHIANLVPSSTRQGAEAFLNTIRQKRETFEYADEDLGELPSIWENYRDGKISLEAAIDMSKGNVAANIQYVGQTARARDIVPDVLENEKILAQENIDQNGQSEANWESAPAITRLESKSNIKLMTIEENEPALRGYRCFIALTKKARENFGDFFLQPHKTSVVWGGQKTLFIFIHHSGSFGLYYDMQTREQLEVPAGGGTFQSCTIMIKNQIYIPVPQAISQGFLPIENQRKRFEVRADIIRTSNKTT